MLRMARQIWHDPVWSKVIAGGIVALVAAVWGGVHFDWWRRLLSTYPIPFWLLVLLIALTLLSLTLLFWKQQQSGEPNITMTRWGIVRASEFEFFPDRETMNRFRDLGEILRNATVIKMILVGGSALIENRPNLGTIREVILPHPRSPSLSLYAGTVDDARALPGKIEAATAKLLDNGIAVKWYPHMINHAVIIADPDLESGWVQWESVLPYAPLNLRPCVIVRKPKFGRLTSSIHNSFNEMFKASETPTFEPKEVRAR